MVGFASVSLVCAQAHRTMGIFPTQAAGKELLFVRPSTNVNPFAASCLQYLCVDLRRPPKPVAVLRQSYGMQTIYRHIMSSIRNFRLACVSPEQRPVSAQNRAYRLEPRKAIGVHIDGKHGVNKRVTP